MATHAHAALSRAHRARALRGIYLILNDDARLFALAAAALDAGVRLLQYRVKRALDPARARALLALARDRGALLLLDDDWRAADAFDYDGVHLGPGDDGFDDPRALRARLGERLIGLSCGTGEEIERANAGDVDYLGIGAVFATASKDDAGAPLGVAGLRRLTESTALPVAAIGGITAENLGAVREAGAAMAAAIGALANAADPRAAAAALLAGWERPPR